MNIPRAISRAVPTVPLGTSPTSVVGRFLAKWKSRIGLGIALFLICTSWFGAAIVPYAPDAVDYTNKLAPPDRQHWLGTDQHGRDQLARILEGGRRSLSAAILVLTGVLMISLVVGITAGMTGGIVDALAMRIVDVLLALPPLVLALAVVGILGVGFQNLLFALVMSSWAYYARLTRSYVVLARQRPDVIADRLAGIAWLRIIIGHIVPGVLTQLLIVATLDLGGIIIGIAGLSFLGLGVQPPTAEWGAMLADARLYIATAPWLLVAPALAILLAVVAANLIGNALRDAADWQSDV